MWTLGTGVAWELYVYRLRWQGGVKRRRLLAVRREGVWVRFGFVGRNEVFGAIKQMAIHRLKPRVYTLPWGTYSEAQAFVHGGLR